MAAIPLYFAGALDDSKALRLFLGIKKRIARRIDDYQAFCILRNLQYLRKAEPHGNFIIKSIAGYKAPADQLAGVTFGAFIFGDTFYQNYLTNGRKDDLDQFIACFYCDKKGFYDKQIEDKAAKIRNASIIKRMAIMVNYGLIREWLALGYPNVFQKLQPGEKKEKGKGWVAVFDSIVGEDIANMEKYAEIPLSTMLRYLNNKTKESYKNGR
jgi:hypothetical protein